MLNYAKAANELISKGYRKVSSRFHHLSRIDREDWKEFMSKDHSSGLLWVEQLGNSAEDQYRRVYSKDVIKVSCEISKRVPTSCFAITGFIKETQK